VRVRAATNSARWPTHRYSVGQGTIHVNSWSPDSTRFTFVSYPVAPDTDA